MNTILKSKNLILSFALLITVAFLLTLVPATGAVAGEKKNPCGMQMMNPCGEKTNPCSMKKNPCATKNPCGMQMMNPCAMKENPCATKNPCAIQKINPCGMKDQSGNKAIRKWRLTDMSAVVKRGERLWVDTTLGKNGLSCSTCHPNGAKLNSKPYPKYINMANDILTLDQMINFCMINPMAGKPLVWNSQKMTSLAAYVTNNSGNANAPNPCSMNPCGKANPCSVKNPCAMKNPCGN